MSRPCASSKLFIKGLPSFYFHYLSVLAHGDRGQSDSLKRPVFDLLRQRLPVTGSLVVRGLGVAWLAATLLTSLGIASRGWFFQASTTAFNSLLLFILTEANLSILGLGVMEPMPFGET